jgi:hypothetical protein
MIMNAEALSIAPTTSELQTALSILRRKAMADAQCAREAEAQEQWTTADAYWARELGLRCAAELVHDCMEGILRDI